MAPSIICTLDGDDFVGFLRHLHLPEHHPLGRRGSGRSRKDFRKTTPSPIAPSISIVTSHAKSEAIHRFRTLPPYHQFIHPIALTNIAVDLDLAARSVDSQLGVAAFVSAQAEPGERTKIAINIDFPAFANPKFSLDEYIILLI